ncbi:MAG: ATP-binding protein [Mucilaginibacter sp.]|uniref:sensor histidine kinase n=1 Tax=Mucilaginibacter sp. TaxID=1882438 RepID=UPI003266370A
MQVSSTDLIYLIGLTSIVFLIAPVSLLIYINLYNRRKKRHKEEKELLQKSFENELLKSQMEVQEQTMQNIASNLHDNIGQLLSLTIVTLSSINLDEPLRVAEKVESAEQLAKRAIKELRQLSRLIYGQELMRTGLASAVAFELDYLKGAGLHTINFNSNYVTKEQQSDNEIILFRIFQEILNNVVRHAYATIIDVNIEQSAEQIRLGIKDNGKSFDIDEILKEQRGMGLFNIRKRVSLIGGDIDIIAIPDVGTEFNIIVPYQ